MNQELIDAMNKVFADTYLMYFKTHSYHWNVEGPNHPQYHHFLEMIYTEVYAVVDTIAEHLRALDAYAPYDLLKVYNLSIVSKDETPEIDARTMMQNLLNANNVVLLSLHRAYDAADKATSLGVSNFLQDRIIAHEKHGWMLKATLK
jgi:starvation-inducible DNA-binding protein